MGRVGRPNADLVGNYKGRVQISYMYPAFGIAYNVYAA